MDMQSNAVVISGKNMDEDQVVDFVAQLETLTGAEVVFEQQWALSSPSESVMKALQLLFSVQPVSHGNLKKGKKVKLSTAALVPGKEDKAVESVTGHEIRAWEVHVPGVTGKTTDPVEHITITEKNIRLAGGRFETGTLLRHPRAGWSKVTGDKGTGQGMTQIEAIEAIRILEG